MSHNNKLKAPERFVAF